MRKRPVNLTLRTLGVLLVLTLLAAACGDDSDQDEGGEAAAEPDAEGEESDDGDSGDGASAEGDYPEELAEPASIRVGGQRVVPDFVFAGMKDELGERYNLDIDFTMYADGGEQNEALLSGQKDVGNGGTAPVVTIADSQPDEVVFVALHQFGAERCGLVVGPETGIEGPEDLEGANIGSSQGSGCHAQFQAWLSQHGMEAGQDVNILNMGPADMPGAISQGTVDGVMVWEPTVAMLEVEGIGERIADMGEMGNEPNFILARSEFAESDPEALARYLAVMLDLAEILDDTDRAAEIAAETEQAETGAESNPEVYSLALERISFDRAVTDDMFDDLELQAERAIEAGDLQEVPDFESLYEPQHLERAEELRGLVGEQ